MDPEKAEDEEPLKKSSGGAQGGDSDETSDEEEAAPPTCTERWEGDKFIWDKEELTQANKKRSKKQELVPIKRLDEGDYEQTIGIRAHDDLTWKKCLKSLIVPWHNEWLLMWLYLGFAIYFWVQFLLILFHSKLYKFNNRHNYEFMLVATLGIALSVTITFVYFSFYSISEKTYKSLNLLDYMGKLVMVFFFTFAFIASELVNSKMYFFFLFSLTAILIINLIIVQYETGRVISLWTTVMILSLVYFYDFIFNSTPKQKEVFYIPIFLELALLGTGYLMYVYQVPERFCQKNRFTALYLTGYIFFQIFVLNLYFESHDILYDSLKLNSGNFDEDTDDWYKFGNVYNK